MIRIIHFFIRQKLFINLMVVIILLMGFMTVSNMNREAFPNVNFDMVTVTTKYTGASPDEVERLISIPIEKELREISGMEKVRAYNIEHVSVIVISIDPDLSKEKKQKVTDDIKDAVESVEDLPATAERPVVEEITLDKAPALDVAITLPESSAENDEAYRALRVTADALEDYLYDIDGVAEVEQFGYLEREYLVEINPSQLERYNIGLNTVVGKLAARNLDLPGGVLRLGDTEYLLRTKGQFRSVNDVRDTVILANDYGYATRLQDIAKVSDTFEEAKTLDRFNGKNAIIFTVWKKESADMLDITDRIKAGLKKFEPPVDQKVEIDTFNDYSRFVRDRLSSLVTNAITGFILLALILFFMLGPRLSAIVGVSIPISFMVAFIGMHSMGLTLNTISMFALIMVLGMIVDFSIVVAENSFRHMEDGWDKITAVEKGTAEVFWPVTVTLLTTSAAFAPLLFMTGLVGKFIYAIPVVIMLSLSASWFAAMFILPNHLETFLKVKTKKKDVTGEKKRDWFDGVQSGYRKFLGLVVKGRYITLVVLIALFFSAIFVSGKFLGFVFFPEGGGETILIRSKMPIGTTLKANLREMKQLENMILETDKKLLESVQTRVGVEIANLSDPAPSEATHRGTFIMNLTPENDRKTTAAEIRDQLRERAEEAKENGTLDKHLFLDFQVDAAGPPVGMPINVEIRGDDINMLKKISQEYMDYLGGVKGVFDITSSLEDGKEEFRYRIDEVKAARAKVSVLDVAQALNSSFEGAVATTIRQDEDEIDVRVRFPEWARQQRRSLSEVKVKNQDGGLVPLSLVASYVKEPGYAMINRLDFKRIGTVKANIDTKVITSVEANKDLAEHFKQIEKRYPGYTVNYGGEEEDRQKSMSNLGVLFLFAMFIIYLILSSFFKSLMTPVVVMSAIPFALVGVVFALLAHGQPMSFMSTLGIVSLAGVIVSNTLVLVEFINNLRKEGYSLFDSLVEGGALRLRPVILTSGTTVLGLFPTIYGLGGKDAFVAPLALSFGYGLIFATFITLVLIPVFYHIAEDFQGLSSAILKRFGIKMNPTLLPTEEGESAVETPVSHIPEEVYEEEPEPEEKPKRRRRKAP